MSSRWPRRPRTSRRRKRNKRLLRSTQCVCVVWPGQGRQTMDGAALSNQCVRGMYKQSDLACPAGRATAPMGTMGAPARTSRSRGRWVASGRRTDYRARTQSINRVHQPLPATRGRPDCSAWPGPVGVSASPVHPQATTSCRRRDPGRCPSIHLTPHDGVRLGRS